MGAAFGTGSSQLMVRRRGSHTHSQHAHGTGEVALPVRQHSHSRVRCLDRACTA